MRFWLLFALLAPWLLYQARRTRRDTPRLPEADGPQQATRGTGEPALRLLIIGESPVAGVGVTHQHDGLGPAIATPLSHHTGRAVHWHCHGTNGLRLHGLLAQPLPADDTAPDLILVMMGVNDTTALTPLRRWRADLHALIRTLTPHASVCFTPVPPMSRFTALPQPLRYVIGLRARQLDQALQDVCRDTGCPYLPYGDLAHPDLLARDGYHPSATGYQLMGASLAGQLIEKLFPLRQSDQ
ncbi:GDSL-like lipase/acylhydrolase domain protein [Isoalcanivorax pacificus W11-5]|uniref:GDSL-like lipase/acylhydrolase domain protein n=1 Tax=Isoalcanivorax pacificus W11-5 TaxID=391936 RepID=A0A0B4XLB4_9GAMM|nr:SGNH/GDSL hydrolase family protein [Isoalcanivorax pacificus]AJD47358.1 GDSL-like lipase/acylhydrolase domain protein [Isoalcanivorax pacificus W11-5]